MRILGLDVGRRRIGVAVSDELGWTAQPVTVIDNLETNDVLEAVAELVREYGTGTIVVGLPRRTDGSYGPEAEYVRAFGERIKQKIKATVEYQDERFSTVEAERTLISSGLRRDRRRRVVDQVAAGLILQAYLDRRRIDNEKRSDSHE